MDFIGKSFTIYTLAKKKSNMQLHFVELLEISFYTQSELMDHICSQWTDGLFFVLILKM